MPKSSLHLACLDAQNTRRIESGFQKAVSIQRPALSQKKFFASFATTSRLLRLRQSLLTAKSAKQTLEVAKVLKLIADGFHACGVAPRAATLVCVPKQSNQFRRSLLAPTVSEVRG